MNIILRKRLEDCKTFDELLYFIYEAKRTSLANTIQIASLFLSLAIGITIVLVLSITPTLEEYFNNEWSQFVVACVLGVIIFFLRKDKDLEREGSKSFNRLQIQFMEQYEKQDFLYANWYEYFRKHKRNKIK